MMQDFGTGNPPSVMVSVRVRGHEFQALVDTEACVKVLRLFFVKDIVCSHLVEHYSDQECTMDGYPLGIKGSVKARMQAGDVDRGLLDYPINPSPSDLRYDVDDVGQL